MLAFRSVYQDIFVQNHIQITEENINFLPLKTTTNITKIFSELNMETKIHTVSDRPRNLKNKANTRQMETIQFFQKNPDTKSLFKKINNISYYAQALNISTNCLKCHGKRVDAPPYIREKYALAYDYKLGDLRGIIEIEMKETTVTQNLDKNYINNIIFLSIFFAFSIIIAFMYASSTKRLAESIQKTQEELERSLQRLDENVLASKTDKKGNIIYASQALCDVSGYSQEELIGANHNIFQHEEMPPTLFQELWKSISSKKTWKGEIKNRKKDGNYFWVYTSIIPTLDSKNKIIAYDSISQDITEKKIKEEFMANMSHELRTPLNAIIGFSSILSKEIKDPLQQNLSKRVHSSSEFLLKLINDILDLSKIQNASFSIERHDFNAYEELTLYSENLQGLINEKQLFFHINISKNLDGMFYGDSLRITQVVFNFISNAIKFTNNHGHIYYTAEYTEDKYLQLSIRDTGIGMNKRVQEKIFKPFVQADGSTTRKYGGTGLGLSINHALISLMAGTIELKSTEGVGTEFITKIPLAQSKTQEVKHSQKNIAKHQFNTHILIVDDQETNQMLLELFLNTFGISCDKASNGLEAIAMYEPSKHQLILMDENMPQMNGTQAMKILKERHQNSCCPIVILTANTMKGEKERFLSLGMDDYISKPIKEEKLYETLKKFLT